MKAALTTDEKQRKASIDETSKGMKTMKDEGSGCDVGSGGGGGGLNGADGTTTTTTTKSFSFSSSSECKNGGSDDKKKKTSSKPPQRSGQYQTAFNPVVCDVAIQGALFCGVVVLAELVHFRYYGEALAVRFSRHVLHSSSSMTIAAVAIAQLLALVVFIGKICRGGQISSFLAGSADLTGKTAIVTGGASGIGKETALQLALWGCNVVLACRNLERGAAAVKDILQHVDGKIRSREKEGEKKEKEKKRKNSSGDDEGKTDNNNNNSQINSDGKGAFSDSSPSIRRPRVILLPLDLADLSSVRSFVDSFLDLKLPLHFLINNAGMMCHEPATTKEGWELTFVTNYLGHFLMTLLLLPKLEAIGGRVINVSSIMHSFVPHIYDFRNYSLHRAFEMKDVLAPQKPFYNAKLAYSVSKLCMVYFTHTLQRRLTAKGSDAVALCCHPGFVQTRFFDNLPLSPFALGVRLSALCFAKSSICGAQTSLFLAVCPKNALQPGGFYSNCRICDISPVADVVEADEELWAVSEELVASYIIGKKKIERTEQ